MPVNMSDQTSKTILAKLNLELGMSLATMKKKTVNEQDWVALMSQPC